jgi:hypothetical protein
MNDGAQGSAISIPTKSDDIPALELLLFEVENVLPDNSLSKN